MKFFRSQRVSNLIREELSKIIFKELEFSGAIFTITEVEVDKDLENAEVYFSVLPADQSERVLKILNKFRSRLHYLLMKKINIKPMPYIIFKIDYGPEKAAEIEKILLEDKN